MEVSVRLVVTNTISTLCHTTTQLSTSYCTPPIAHILNMNLLFCGFKTFFLLWLCEVKLGGCGCFASLACPYVVRAKTITGLGCKTILSFSTFPLPPPQLRLQPPPQHLQPHHHLFHNTLPLHPLLLLPYHVFPSPLTASTLWLQISRW